ncbi:MAG: hypothetical protein GX409_02295 [candidate division Zixibacteria bacterium]|jgi:hypothetical protein|nr:hypothetical protein [candidate division Zixibacteria bacterium]
MADFERHKGIPILFNYIAEYETGGKFDNNEFINYFENVMAHLRTVQDRNNLEIVKNADEMLLAEIDKVPFNSPKGGSDIRYFSAHILATAFPILIPMAAQYQNAYRYCFKLRQNKADIDFLELELSSYLLDRDLLKRNDDLRYYFLSKIAEIQNLAHDPNILEEPEYQNLDKLETLPPSRLFLALRRRNLKTEASILIQNKQLPEHKLSEYRVFSKMAEANPVHRDILLKMGYLNPKTSLIGRLKQGLITIFQFIMGLFRAPRYIWFVLNKSRGNLVFFLTCFLAAILIVMAFAKLMKQYRHKLYNELNRSIEEIRR